jgi:hypothetical protein
VITLAFIDRRRGGASPMLEGRSRPFPPWASPLAACALATAATVVGWRGVDYPAQLYRIGLFHRDGLVLWDSQWYGGHWTFGYSVIFTPVAGILGVQATAVLSAGAAALAFDRLVVGHFGERARVGALVFAVGTLAEVAIGQLPFLLGESLALAACLAAARRRWPLAVVLTLASALASPLAGGFLAMASCAWLVASWPKHRGWLAALAAAGLVPVVAGALLFPGEGPMPFPAWDFLQIAALFVGVWLVLPSRERALRIGAAVYVAAIAVAFALATPVGGNISRLGECLGAPLAVCALWPRRRWLASAALVPLVLLQWAPAFAALTSDGADPSTHAAYFQPLLRFLSAHNTPVGRIEVVPTRLHWEAAFVAPRFALARGWERQLDTADNPVFYKPDALTGTSYREWLLDNGVRLVALPDVPLDYAATGEARLVSSGVAGLGTPQRVGHWRIYPVLGSVGLLQGPGELTRMDGSQVTLYADAPSTFVLRVRYDPRWTVVGDAACLTPGPGPWTTLTVARVGETRLALRLVGGGDTMCSTSSAS